MRIKENYLLREIADTYIVVPCGEALSEFRGTITLNETGAFLWKLLQSEQTEEALVLQLTEAFAVDSDTALRDVDGFLTALREAALLVEA